MKKVQNEEIKNVSGGVCLNTVGGVQCPACKTRILWEKAFVKRTHECIIATNHYKCPKCGKEWKE